MTTTEAISKMQSTIEAAKERLDGNGFIMSVDTTYANQTFRPVDDIKKARFVTMYLIVAKEGGEKGEEYCLSIGAMITKNGVDEAALEKNIAQYEHMIDEAVEVLAGYENKNEGLDYLTEKANEEYKDHIAKIQEENKKRRRISTISNVIFIIAIAIFFILALRS